MRTEHTSLRCPIYYNRISVSTLKVNPLIDELRCLNHSSSMYTIYLIILKCYFWFVQVDPVGSVKPKLKKTKKQDSNGSIKTSKVAAGRPCCTEAAICFNLKKQIVLINQQS